MAAVTGRRSAEEEGPDGVYEGVGEGGGGDAVVATSAAPCTAVEEACEGGEQDVAPVEVDGALVEVREAKKDGGEGHRPVGAEAALQEVLKPAAEEELFGDGDEEEGEEECARCDGRTGKRAMQVEKAEGETEGYGNGCVEKEVDASAAEVFEAQAEIEAGAMEPAHDDEAPEPGVDEQHFAEDGEVRRPGGLEPAKVDGEAEAEEDEEVGPDAVLFGICAGRVMKEHGYCDRDKDIEEQPGGTDCAGVEVDEDVGDRKQGGCGEAHGERKRFQAVSCFERQKSKGEVGQQGEDSGYRQTCCERGHVVSQEASRGRSTVYQVNVAKLTVSTAARTPTRAWEERCAWYRIEMESRMNGRWTR